MNRRNFLKLGIGTLGTATAVNTVAQICGDLTGKQPLGPFFPNEGTPIDPVREPGSPLQTPIAHANDNDLTVIKGRNTDRAQGQIVYLRGKVTDVNCNPIENASIIIWQASHSGRYNHLRDADNLDFAHPKTGKKINRSLDEGFQSWGKAITNANGEYSFKTIVPGFYPADLENAWYRPPHIHFMVTAKNYQQLVTQTYFRGEKLIDNEWIQELNKKDALLQSTSISSSQREHLVVHFDKDPTGQLTDGLLGTFDITLIR